MKIKLIIAMAVMVLFAGCKKDEATPDDTTGIPKSGCFISTVVTGTDKTVYIYDSDNRVIKIESFDSNVLDYYETYTYTNTNVTIKYFKGNGTADGQNIAEMQNGRITKAVGTDSYTSNGFVYNYTYTSTYEYNSSGFLIKEIGEDKTTSNKPNEPVRTSTGTIIYTYQNENLTQKVENYQSSNGNSTLTYTFEYYTDKDNVINLGYEIGDFDDNYVFLFGKQSKNLIKKVSYTERYISNGVTQNYSDNSAYTYTYDANGKPNKATELRSSINNGVTTNETSVHNLTLNCK